MQHCIPAWHLHEETKILFSDGLPLENAKKQGECHLPASVPSLFRDVMPWAEDAWLMHFPLFLRYDRPSFSIFSEKIICFLYVHFSEHMKCAARNA